MKLATIALAAVVTTATTVAAVAPLAPKLPLSNGVEMPQVALGTWKYNPDQAGEAVKMALKLGYTHIDTAHNYKNHVGIGKALKEVGVPRKNYFLTTKVPGGCNKDEGCYDYDLTLKTNEQTLVDLQLEYVDCMLIHFPPLNTPQEKYKEYIQGQWKALEVMYRQGKTRSIGVSNYCQSDIEIIMEIATIPPMVNQILYHVGMGEDPQDLVSYCKKHNILIQAYSPLAIKAGGSSELINGQFTTEMGKKYGKSSVQVALKYITQQNMVVLPQSNKESHLLANADLFSWELSDEDMKSLKERTVPEGSPSFAHKCGEVSPLTPSLKLANGVEMPQVALGTWKYNADQAGEAVKMALKLGYTHIDTAHDYNNHVGIGKALKQLGISREKYFLTTKVPGGCIEGEGCYDYDLTLKTNEQTLVDLQLEYVDCMLIHFPPLKIPQEKYKEYIQGQWKALEVMYQQGKTRSIGVSNYCQSDIEIIMEIATIPPMVNQILYHVGMGEDPQDLVSYCKKHNILIQAYSPLAIKAGGSSELINGQFTTEMGKKYGKSSVQVALKYITQQNMVVLPQSNKESHLLANADLFSWELNDEDMKSLKERTVPEGSPSFAHKCGSSTSSVVADIE